MTTVTKIIDRAFRVSNMTAAGQSPTSTEQSEALELLQSFVKGVFGNEAGDDFTDMAIGSVGIERPSGFPWYDTIPDGNDWFVREDYRLFVNINQPVTLYLHPQPDDGARFAIRDMQSNFSTYNVTLSGNGRLIDGASTLVLSTDGEAGEWFYRADLGQWVKYADLVLGNEFPFPEEFDDYFVMSLAMRLNPQYGKTIDQQSLTFYNRSKNQLRARYNVTIFKASERGLLRMSRMTADRYRWRSDHGTIDPTRAFSRGYPF